MPAPLRLGIAGLGTVGAGVVRIAQAHAETLAARAGRPVEIAAVTARSRTADRGIDISPYPWAADPVALAERRDVDVLVELMGGADGPAKAATEAALAAGKDVVTANKAMLATHGQALAETAEARGAALRFEAAVAGGIPVVKTLTEGLAANRITRVMGVLNGTCNYILTRMEGAGLPYDDVFEEARRLGYLEADPELDVGGIDAAHKLALLAATAFGTRIAFDRIDLEGIDRVSIADISHARDMGFRIKLLGIAEATPRGIEQRIAPCLVPADSALGQLEGPANMTVLEGDSVGQIAIRGAGAGAGPTASAVMADVIDLGRGMRRPTFGAPAADLADPVAARAGAAAPFYLRMALADEPGALARVATVLGETGISIDRMRQYRHPAATAPVLMVTHPTPRDRLDKALAAFAATGVVATDPVVLRIETV